MSDLQGREHELAAKKAELERLKALRAQQQGQQQQQQPEYGYEYDDMDDDDDIYDDDEFGEDIDALPANDPDFDEMLAAAAPGDEQRVLPVGAVDEEEVLKYAKKGDFATFAALEKNGQLPPLLGIRDNQGATLLHYAAEGGNADFVKYLLGKGFDATAADDTNASPQDVAVLLRHEAAAAALGATADAASVVERLATEPAKFALSKAPPTVQAYVRTVWGKPTPTQPPSDIGCSVSELGDPKARVPTISKAPQPDSFLGWTRYGGGSDEMDLQIRMRQHNVVGRDQNGAAVASLAIAPLGNACVKGAAHPQPFYLAARLSARERFASGIIQYAAGYLANCTCAVVTPKSLPIVKPAATCKFYRRSCDPAALFATAPAAAALVYPDVERFLESKRSGIVRRHGLTQADQAQPIDDWRLAAEADCAAIAALVAAAAFDVGFAPSAEAVQHLFLGCAAIVPLVRTAADGSVTDFVVLQRRTGPSGFKCALLAYAVFTSVTGAEKMRVALRLAQRHAEAMTLFATNTMGVTDSDMRLAKFDEVPQSHQHVYVLQAPNSSVPDVATTAPKLGIPLLL